MEGSRGRILVIEDEKSMREVMKILLEEEAYDVTVAVNGEEGIGLLRDNLYDLVITDIRMPRADGFQVLRHVREYAPDTMVIMVTAFGTTESAIDAMKMGAYGYVQKPFKIDEIRLSVRKALEKKRLSEEVSLLREKFQTSFRLENIIGKSDAMQDIFRLIPRVAQSSSAVLITGESGTGKELVAAALHNLSPRRQKNFVTVNCTTFPEGLLESEMFGHMKGSFTGAVASKSGLFEIADGGTFFLDEIGDMPMSLQAKLLRVLENGTFRRVGGTSDITVDVRVVSATNKNIAGEVAAGNFREDLYYRLNVVPMNIPPLRERPSDIPLLVEHFLAKYARGPKRISPEAVQVLMKCQWKGNVRELEHVVERMVLLSDGDVILPADIPADIRDPEAGLKVLPEIGEEGFDLEGVLERIERQYLLSALERTRGVKTEAARVLNLSFRSLRHRLHKYGLK